MNIKKKKREGKPLDSDDGSNKKQKEKLAEIAKKKRIWYLSW